MNLIIFLSFLLAKPPHPPTIPDSRIDTYRTVGDTELKVWIIGESDPKEPKPAIIFFFGGGWKTGTPKQFEPQARHFAERGMLCLLADYRVETRQQVLPVECVKDAKACLAWTRENAQQLGIIPDQIACAGGSAGGHLAGATGTLPGLGSEERPNALLLFNPALLLSDLGKWKMGDFGRERKLGIPAIDLSPAHHVGPHTPPTLILHGTKDKIVPFFTAQAFEDAMKKAKRPCKLVAYEGQGHGFFNRGEPYQKTLAKADQFLTQLGWLKPVTSQ
ncbi:MAG: alpha/beta hydrolase [Verrucomicrobiota bacterium]